jgi:Chaperone of endosialidase
MVSIRQFLLKSLGVANFIPMFMKKIFRGTAVLLLLAAFNAHLVNAHAQGTAFTYQGQLNTSGSPANGIYDFRFLLAANTNGSGYVGSPVTVFSNQVNNGLFTVTIDFGAGILNGSNYWLEVDVRTNGASSYTALAPIQPLTPVPYAIFANTASSLDGTLPATALTGTYSGAVTLNNPANSFSGNGTGLTNLNATTLGGLAATNFWKTVGNAGTTTNNNFLGTTDNQPLEVRVNGVRVLRLEPDPRGFNGTSVIGGFPGNADLQQAGNPSGGNVIAGGGSTNAANIIDVGSSGGFIGAGGLNYIGANLQSTVITGGAQNTNRSVEAVIGGGLLNQIQANASYATIGGGRANIASGLASVIGGGGYDGNFFAGNTNAGNGATIGGGVGNLILSNTRDSTISGGYKNQIQSGGIGSVIAGGSLNVISGIESFIGCGGFDGNTDAPNSIAANDAVIVGGRNNQILLNGRLSVIGGGDSNEILSSGYNAAIVGGYGNVASGAGSFIGGGGYDGSAFGGNTNAGNAAVIGGGLQNHIQSGENYATIGGGGYNKANGVSATIAGGYLNQVNNTDSTVGGGWGNVVSGIGSVIGGGGHDGVNYAANTNAGNAAVIGGGFSNKVQTNALYAVVGGGASNTISGRLGAIPGGDQNVASTNGFAAGHRAKAIDQGAFVWADATEADFSDSGINTFNIRAAGGVVFTNGAGQSVSWNPGAGSWAFTSDRNAKENFKSVDALGILEKVSRLPLTEWSYRGFNERHVGPMAQDFHAAFPMNANDKMLNSADEAGITMAAVQGLNRKVDAETAALRAENAQLKERLNALEKIIRQHESN